MPAQKPSQRTTQLLDDLRAAALPHLLIAATTRFDVGEVLADHAMTYDALRSQLGLAERAAIVLLTGLRSLELIDITDDNLLQLTEYGREKLSPHSPYNLRGYIELGASSPDVQNMIACLQRDAPAGNVSFVFHDDGKPSTLDDPVASDALTRAMASRATNVAPFLADIAQLQACTHLVDVGGGHGIYSFELLKRFPDLTAAIIDREPPLKVADEIAGQEGLKDRVTLLLGDIHTYPLAEKADAVLLANILHDYGTSDAERLVAHYAGQLRPGGRMMILDSFLDSTPVGAPPISAGPRAVAAYSAMLFSITEGRCYRLDEYQNMMTSAGLKIEPLVETVPAHGRLLTGGV